MITIVIEGVCLVGIVRILKFIMFDKYETMVKSADIDCKIIKGKCIENGGYLATGIYMLSQMVVAVL